MLHEDAEEIRAMYEINNQIGRLINAAGIVSIETWPNWGYYVASCAGLPSNLADTKKVKQVIGNLAAAREEVLDDINNPAQKEEMSGLLKQQQTQLELIQEAIEAELASAASIGCKK